MTGSNRRSEILFERAQRSIPGGVNSPVRSYSAVGGAPRFLERGSGAFVWDVDGNEYIDYVMSWGPLIHGHAFAPVVYAVESAAAYGTSFGAPTESEVALAEFIAETVPTVEMARLVSSGTEASMSTIRLARACTGRDSIVKFAGNYHGHVDALLAHSGSGSLTLGVPSSPGVTASAAADTLVAPYNDVDALGAIFDEHGGDIAAVIVEPIAGNMGVVPSLPGFLQAIRRLTSAAGSLFICDEVITGYRVGLGGAQGLYDIAPDLTVLGKIIGGGLPVGAYGGERALMMHVAPVGDVYQAGTLSGNPLATRAGLANLKPLREPGFYDCLERTTLRLATGLRAAAHDAGIPVTVNTCTGMLTLFFTRDEVTTLEEAQTSDAARFGRFFHAMLDRGVSLPPSQFEAWMVSSRHTDDVVDRTVEAAHAALTAVKET